MNVVLLHGLGADHRAFQRFQRLLPESWHVEAWDLLGHGDAPHPEHGYGLEDHASYIAGEITRRWGDPPSDADLPVLVGHSYGAATATALVAARPDLVRGLVLLDPIVYREHPMGSGRSATEQMIEGRREGTMGATVDRLFPSFSPALRRWTTETWERMAVGVVNEIDHDWMRFAPDVTVPVQVVHGDLDQGGGGDFAAPLFAAAQSTRIEGAGHYLHATHARETAAAVIAAVEAVAAQGAH